MDASEKCHRSATLQKRTLAEEWCCGRVATYIGWGHGCEGRVQGEGHWRGWWPWAGRCPPRPCFVPATERSDLQHTFNLSVRPPKVLHRAHQPDLEPRTHWQLTLKSEIGGKWQHPHQRTFNSVGLHTCTEISRAIQVSALATNANNHEDPPSIHPYTLYPPSLESSMFHAILRRIHSLVFAISEHL